MILRYGRTARLYTERAHRRSRGTEPAWWREARAGGPRTCDTIGPPRIRAEPASRSGSRVPSAAPRARRRCTRARPRLRAADANGSAHGTGVPSCPHRARQIAPRGQTALPSDDPFRPARVDLVVARARAPSRTGVWQRPRSPLPRILPSPLAPALDRTRHAAPRVHQDAPHRPAAAPRAARHRSPGSGLASAGHGGRARRPGPPRVALGRARAAEAETRVRYPRSSRRTRAQLLSPAARHHHPCAAIGRSERRTARQSPDQRISSAAAPGAGRRASGASPRRRARGTSPPGPPLPIAPGAHPGPPARVPRVPRPEGWVARRGASGVGVRRACFAARAGERIGAASRERARDRRPRRSSARVRVRLRIWAIEASCAPRRPPMARIQETELILMKELKRPSQAGRARVRCGWRLSRTA